MKDFGLSRVSLSTAYFVGTVASGLTLPSIGRLFDHWGARRMIVLASVTTGMMLLFLSESASLARWLGGVFPGVWKTGISFSVIGLGFYLIRLSAQGILTMTSRNVVGKWFDHRRGMALAVSGIFISFGFSVAPKFLDLLIQQFDYNGAWRFLAFLTFFVMAPLGWLIFRDNPEECGLKMDGPNVAKPKKVNPDMVIHREYNRREVLRTYAFHVFNLSFAFFALYSTAFTFHIVSLGHEFGFEKSRIINLFIPIAVISVIINLFFGWINSRIRLKYMLLTMNIGAVLAAVGLLFLDSPPGIPIYVIGNGITSGVFSSLAGIVWPRFFGRLWLGAISGLCMSSMVIASGFGPWLFALAHQMSGSYQSILIVSVFVPAVLCIASFWADNPQRKET